MVWHELFLHTSMGVGRGARIGKFQQKKLSSYFQVLKNKLHHVWPPLEKRLEKSTSGSPGKISSDVHAHKYVKFHQFCEKLCCITPSGNNVQQQQCGRPKQSTAGRQAVHGVFWQTITESCRNYCQIRNNIDEILPKICNIFFIKGFALRLDPYQLCYSNLRYLGKIRNLKVGGPGPPEIKVGG